MVGHSLFDQLNKSGIAADCGGEGIALNIKFHIGQRFNQSRQTAHIIGPNMALVGARVDRDAIGTLVDTELGKGHYIRIITLAGIANEGDFIEVNTEIGHIIARV